MNNMSTAAKSALINARSSKQGEVVNCKIDGDVDRELQTLGLTGSKGGLTRKGTIAREKLMSAALDEAFGA